MSRTFRKTAPYFTQTMIDSDPDFYNRRLKKAHCAYDGKLQWGRCRAGAIEGRLTGWDDDLPPSSRYKSIAKRKARLQLKTMLKAELRQHHIDEQDDYYDMMCEMLDYEWYDDTPMEYQHFSDQIFYDEFW